jgi:hypothetical protein
MSILDMEPGDGTLSWNLEPTTVEMAPMPLSDVCAPTINYNQPTNLVLSSDLVGFSVGTTFLLEIKATTDGE